MKRRNSSIATTVRLLAAAAVLASAVPTAHASAAQEPLPSPDISSSLVRIERWMEDVSRQADGVLVEMDEKTYILTSQRNLLGADKIRFTTTAGARLAPVQIELSTTSDLARLRVEENLQRLSCSSTVNMHMPISLLMSENTTEQKRVAGRVIGVGGTKIEITAAFDAMKSGAPILNSNQVVVGIASYSRDASKRRTTIGTRFEEAPRYFGCRIRSDEWVTVNWKKYNHKFGKPYYQTRTFFDEVLEILQDEDPFEASAKEAVDRATACRTHARKSQLMAEQKGITGFLRNEFEEQVDVLEYAANWFSDYAGNR